MKVAIIHDWIIKFRGGEKVLEAICELYENADLFTLIYRENSTNPTIENRKIYTSLLQYLPFGINKHGLYLPVMPIFAELWNLQNYDLIISSSHAVAKNVRKNKRALHISYIHSPIRYIWDMFDEYFNRYFGKLPKLIYSALYSVIKTIVYPWRWWDRYTANRVDYFIANSDFVGKRIEKYYSSVYKVIHPPVDVEDFIPNETIQKQNYYIVVGAIVPYKRVDLVVEAFNISGKELIVIGEGSQSTKIKQIAKNNIHFLGHLPRSEMVTYLQKARGFIYPQIEDCGITAIESQAAGTPVIAFAKGGALETVVDGETGLFYNEQSPESLNKAIDKFEMLKYDTTKLINNARRFNKERFKQELKSYIDQCIAEHSAKISK